MTAEELFKKFLERLEFNTVHSAFNLALTEYREGILKMIDEKRETVRPDNETELLTEIKQLIEEMK